MYKIYQIINIDGQRYVGSTKQTLEARYQQHTYKRYTSSIVMAKPHTMLLIETLGTDKGQALRRERYWIDTLKNCVNIEVPYSSLEQKKVCSDRAKKKYLENNRQKHNKRTVKYNKKRSNYQKTWGEPINKIHRDTPNNLLLIDTNLFL